MTSFGLTLVAYYIAASRCRCNVKSQPVIRSISPERGPSAGGNIVTLRGENFLPSDKESVHCKFGSQSSPVSFLSNEEVKCVSPSGSVVREVQAVKITGGSSDPTPQGSFTLGFQDGVKELCCFPELAAAFVMT